MIKRFIQYVKKRRTSDSRPSSPRNKTLKKSPKKQENIPEPSLQNKTARRSPVRTYNKTKKNNEIRFPTPPSNAPILFPEVPAHEIVLKPKDKNELIKEREILANRRNALLYDIYNIYMDSNCPKSKIFIEKNKELVKITNEAKEIDAELKML